MTSSDPTAFAAAMSHLHAADMLLDNTDAGVCLIHLSATIAALESRTKRLGMPPQEAEALLTREARKTLSIPWPGNNELSDGAIERAVASAQASGDLSLRLAELKRVRSDYRGDERVPGLSASLDFLIAETAALLDANDKPVPVGSQA